MTARLIIPLRSFSSRSSVLPSSILNLTLGCSFMKPANHSAAMSGAMPSTSPIAMVPRMPCPMASMSAWVLSARLSMSLALRYRSCPDSVSLRCRLPLMNSTVSSSDSRFLICELRGGWLMCSFSAALVILSSSATVTKYCRVLSSILLPHILP